MTGAIGWYTLFWTQTSLGPTDSTETLLSTRPRGMHYKQWYTKEQLAWPNVLNSMAHANLLIARKALPERPHEIKELADEGIMQYQYIDAAVQSEVGNRSEAGVSAEAELKSNEYKDAQIKLREACPHNR